MRFTPKTVATRLLPLLLLLISLVPWNVALAQAPDAKPAPAFDASTSTGEVIVKVSRKRKPALAGGFQILGAVDGTGDSQFLRLRLPATEDVGKAVRDVLSLPDVESVEPNYLIHGMLQPNDPAYRDGQQWALAKINAPSAWDVTTGSQLVVAFLDSGMSLSHPDLAGKIIPGYDFVNSAPTAADDNGHGTWTAGIAAAMTNNAAGVAGVTWGARIMPIKVLDSNGAGNALDMAKGLRYAVDHGARIVNVSAGGPGDSSAVRDAVQYAESKGVLVVAAAGNKPGEVDYPAAYDQVLAVAATDSSDNAASFSSYGPYVDLAAPGVAIWGTGWNNGRDAYMVGSGTSASAPLVSGAAALVLSANPGLSNEQVRTILSRSADDVAAPGWDQNTGWGRLNLARAVRVAAGQEQLPLKDSRIQGVVSHAVPSDVVVRLDPVGLTTTPQADGYFNFGSLAAGTYTVTAQTAYGRTAGPITVSVNGTASDVKSIALDFPVQVNPAFVPLPSLPDAPDRLYFPETGHTVSFGFKSYWDSHGGVAVFGLPISEEFSETNTDTGQVYTVQYFERARFEYHPEFAGTPYEVSLGRLGAVLTQERAFGKTPAFTSTPDRMYIPETGHSLAQPFLSYWQSNGGLAIFGYPISEPFQEAGYTVQYFERNRFEYHPDLPSPYVVSLGLLGDDYARRMGYLP